MRTITLSLTARMKLYKDALELRRKKGWGNQRIGHELGISKNTVGNWLYLGDKPNTTYNYPVLYPSPELSYVIGVCYGDGSAYSAKNRWGKYKIIKEYRIRLSAIDRDFVDEFNRCVSKVLGRSRYPVYFDKRKGAYTITAYSRLLHDFLKEHLRKEKETIERYPADFVRGFFDSEGTISVRGKTIHEIKAYNTNKEVLTCIKNSLQTHFSINAILRRAQPGKTSRCKKPYFELAISGQESMKKYCDFIGFTIARKMEKLRGAEFSVVERMKKYRDALAFRKEGRTIPEIEKCVGINRSTIWSWVYNGHRPNGHQQRRVR